jgi:NADPH2:quinone reductase
MVHAFGNRVFATAGTPEKCAACRELGAEVAINYRTEDFVEAVKQATAGRGVDVILDMVGGDYVARELKALASDGRLVLIAFLAGAKATVNLADIMMRRLVLTGSTLRARTPSVKADIARSLRDHVWPLIETGKMRPVIHAVFPLDQANSAHALMESGAHIGKLVLTVR